MREMTVEIGGKERTLAATFQASIRIAQKVGDPLMIAREAGIEAQMSEMGLTYTPKWLPSITNVPVILHEGLVAAGAKVTLEDVQEWVFDKGFLEAKEAAIEYIALIVTPKPSAAAEAGEPGKP